MTEVCNFYQNAAEQQEDHYQNQQLKKENAPKP